MTTNPDEMPVASLVGVVFHMLFTRTLPHPKKEHSHHLAETLPWPTLEQDGQAMNDCMVDFITQVPKHLPNKFKVYVPRNGAI